MRSYKRLAKIALTLLSVSFASTYGADDLFLNSTPPDLAPVEEQSHAPEMPPPTATDAEKLQKVIEEQLATIKSFDISKAYYAYTTREFQKTVSLDAFKQFVKKNAVIFRNKNIIRDHVSFTSNIAIYEGRLVSMDGEVYKVEIVFIFRDDEWKIQSIQLKTSDNKKNIKSP